MGPDGVVPWNVSIAQPVRPSLARVLTADGQRNVWFVGDSTDCAVIDPAGSVGDLLGQCDARRLRAILWTTVWPESVALAISLADYTGAVMYLDTERVLAEVAEGLEAHEKLKKEQEKRQPEIAKRELSRWPLIDTMPGFNPPEGEMGPVTPAMMTLFGCMVVVGITPG